MPSNISAAMALHGPFINLAQIIYCFMQPDTIYLSHMLTVGAFSPHISPVRILLDRSQSGAGKRQLYLGLTVCIVAASEQPHEPSQPTFGSDDLA